jgi:hypothetical protein
LITIRSSSIRSSFLLTRRRNWASFNIPRGYNRNKLWNTRKRITDSIDSISRSRDFKSYSRNMPSLHSLSFKSFAWDYGVSMSIGTTRSLRSSCSLFLRVPSCGKYVPCRRSNNSDNEHWPNSEPWESNRI